ncbi:MAG: ATP-dependent protease, partial [Planctomycetota bacterium]
SVRDAVAGARQYQQGRQTVANARLSGKALDEHAPMSEEASTLLRRALTELGLSARAYDKIRRIARTIAELDRDPLVAVPHIAEAIGYRLLGRATV